LSVHDVVEIDGLWYCKSCTRWGCVGWTHICLPQPNWYASRDELRRILARSMEIPNGVVIGEDDDEK
jgi:hypothetical protein